MSASSYPAPAPPSSFGLLQTGLGSGHTYSYLDLPGASLSSPTLLLLHGFPDSWYGWANFFVPWNETRGFRLIVPSMLGYAGSGAVSPLVYARVPSFLPVIARCALQ